VFRKNDAVRNYGTEQEKWIKEVLSKKRSAIDENLASMKTIDRTIHYLRMRTKDLCKVKCE